MPEVDALHPALAFDHPGWKGSVEKQAELSKKVGSDLGFDFTKGRFDVSTHPFTGGACPTDVRITTRYSDGNWFVISVLRDSKRHRRDHFHAQARGLRGYRT